MVAGSAAFGPRTSGPPSPMDGLVATRAIEGKKGRLAARSLSAWNCARGGHCAGSPTVHPWMRVVPKTEAAGPWDGEHVRKIHAATTMPANDGPSRKGCRLKGGMPTQGRGTGSVNGIIFKQSPWVRFARDRRTQLRIAIRNASPYSRMGVETGDVIRAPDPSLRIHGPEHDGGAERGHRHPIFRHSETCRGNGPGPRTGTIVPTLRDRSPWPIFGTSCGLPHDRWPTWTLGHASRRSGKPVPSARMPHLWPFAGRRLQDGDPRCPGWGTIWAAPEEGHSNVVGGIAAWRTEAMPEEPGYPNRKAPGWGPVHSHSMTAGGVSVGAGGVVVGAGGGTNRCMSLRSHFSARRWASTLVFVSPLRS